MGDAEHGPEQRQAPRSRRRRRVRIDPGGIQALTGDISPAGAFVLTSHPLPAGSRIQLTFSTPEYQVRTEGLVRWVRRVSHGERGPEPIGLGIEFVAPLEPVQPLG